MKGITTTDGFQTSLLKEGNQQDPELQPIPARSTTFKSVIDENRAESDGCCEKFVIILAWILVIIIPVFWCQVFKTVKDFERALIFRLGKLEGEPRGPGLFIINPLTDKMIIVNLRIEVVNLFPQDMMTKDSVTVKVDGIVYTKVTDPMKAILEVDNYRAASKFFAATSLRSVIGSFTLDTLLGRRDVINSRLRQIIEQETQLWGVTVTAVEVKDVVLPTKMQRAMASEAEADRERKAKVVSSLGEVQAADNLAKAASTITQSPGALQLRYLHTLKNISVEKNSTILFPLPMELMKGFMQKNGGALQAPPRGAMA